MDLNDVVRVQIVIFLSTTLLTLVYRRAELINIGNFGKAYFAQIRAYFCI